MGLAIRGSAPKQSPLQGPTNVRSYRPGLSTKTCRPCIFTVCPTGKQHLPRQIIRFGRRRLVGLHDCSRLLNFSNTLPKGQATFFFFSFPLPFSTIQTCCLFWQSSLFQMHLKHHWKTSSTLWTAFLQQSPLRNQRLQAHPLCDCLLPMTFWIYHDPWHSQCPTRGKLHMKRSRRVCIVRHILVRFKL